MSGLSSSVSVQWFHSLVRLVQFHYDLYHSSKYSKCHCAQKETLNFCTEVVFLINNCHFICVVWKIY